MRQILITRNGGMDVLKIVERPRPTPRPGEVLISVKVSDLNFADILAREGLYLMRRTSHESSATKYPGLSKMS